MSDKIVSIEWQRLSEWQKAHAYYCQRGNHVILGQYHRSGSSHTGGNYWTCPKHFGVSVAAIIDPELDIPANAHWEIKQVKE